MLSSFLLGILACSQTSSSIELEENDVSIFHDVSLSLLSVLASSLRVKWKDRDREKKRCQLDEIKDIGPEN